MPVRRRATNPPSWQVLLVQSRWTPAIWLFPKGGVEKDESPKAAAVRETVEEGGVVGDLGPKLGVWAFDRGSKVKQKMWLLHVHTQHPDDSKLWKERKKRRRMWHSLDSARHLLTDLPDDLRRPELLEMLDAAEAKLDPAAAAAAAAADPDAPHADDTDDPDTDDTDTPAT